ncbi:MAG: DUF5320 domain-containing protein [Clostridia bacterium]|nr:DUF5320 domain-containing protein [Clostridia bacterium]
MPRGDRSGPAGLGPMTGRAAGYCAGFPMPGFLNSFIGRLRGKWGGYGPWGCGRGGGMGWRRAGFFGPVGYPGPVSPYAGMGYDTAAEAAALSREAEFLKQQLGAIESRLEQLEKEKKESPGESQD